MFKIWILAKKIISNRVYEIWGHLVIITDNQYNTCARKNGNKFNNLVLDFIIVMKTFSNVVVKILDDNPSYVYEIWMKVKNNLYLQ